MAGEEESDRLTEEQDDASDSRVIVCPRCKVPAQQVWSDLQEVPPGLPPQNFWDESAASRRELFAGFAISSRWKSAHCQGCDQKTLWRDGRNVYPVASSAPAAHPQMNPEVKALFEEAGRVLPLSRRAGAALIRAALEKQLKILDPDAPSGARLDDHIARLSSRVSKPLGELLDVVRYLGNSALHGSGEDELVYLYLSDSKGSDDIAELLFGAINDLTDELIARPANTSALWNKLPPGIKDAIARKQAAAAQ